MHEWHTRKMEIHSRPQRPFSIRIFLPDGSSDGLRVVEKSNWTGKGVVVPRTLLQQASHRDELQRTGVYILVGSDEESDALVIYIGQGDPVGDRLNVHAANKEFWSWVVFFVTRDDSLNKAHVAYLESKLIRLAIETKRAKLDNINTPHLPTLTEAYQADMDSFLDDILAILPVIGLHAFEKPAAPIGNRRFYFLGVKGVRAQGYESSQGFVVQIGSTAVIESLPSIPAFAEAIRNRLIQERVLVEDGEYLHFAQDYVFSSSSTAAAVVLGRAASGPGVWKDDQNRSLRVVNLELTQGL